MSSDTPGRPVCIAVLPFENLSDRREDEYFSRGFVEDLITDLSHFRSLQVISSYTSHKLGAGARQAVDTARELDIDYLLKGNLRRVSDHVRLSAQLLDTAGGQIVWDNRFDMPMDAIFEMQDEVVAWLKKANPFKFEDDMQHLIQGVMAAGLSDRGDSGPPAGDQGVPATPVDAVANRFVKQDGLWRISFEGRTVRMSEMKGFIDITRLLAVPENEIHCAELMGSPDSLSEPESMLDEKARRAYEIRIRDLREEIAEAEAMNDLGRTEKLSAELDQLTDHLSRSLGLGRRPRKLDADTDRARAAVTWRIRNAIRKIESVHPSLANHLSHAIRTGAFCSYNPEKDTHWDL